MTIPINIRTVGAVIILLGVCYYIKWSGLAELWGWI